MCTTASSSGRYAVTAALLLMIASAAGAGYSGGSGTVQDPYQIATAADLLRLGESPADYGKCFILTADIDLDPNLPGGKVFDKAVIAPVTVSWAGSGRTKTSDRFVGAFDGHNHKISHLRIIGSNYLGLFGRLELGAEVKNLALADVNVVGSGAFVGGLAGSSGARVAQCCTTGQVRGDSFVGGLVGENAGQAKNCYSTCAADANEVVGGLAGSNAGDIAACYSAGKVTGRQSAGGLVGIAALPGAVAASFWDVQTSGQAVSAGGTDQTTVQMQREATFLSAAWDFVDENVNGTEEIWRIDEGMGYPRLAWEPETPPPASVLELDDTNFDKQIAQGTILVDFFAKWCPHCTIQAPILDEVAERVQGRARVAKLDVDQAPSIAHSYGVTAIPALIVFKDGLEVRRFAGVTSADVLVAAMLSQ
jgi:thioredoxin